jgi:Na+/H+ antiporter NhaD/arsenite permease-like protein
METAIAAVFIAGYICIATEHLIKINKSAVALLTGVLCWVLFAVSSHDKHGISTEFLGYVSNFSGILFFLMGAMVIVELIDMHGGFEVITGRITTRRKRALLWIISILAFFLSAMLDNLTTTIVMISLIFKLLTDKNDRFFFVSMVVIAANAGGAWTPIGDVTTTMLWIGGQITTGKIITTLFLPSIACLVVPLALASFRIKGETAQKKLEPRPATAGETFEKNLVLCLGIGALVFVPVFKTITHLPPFMGMMFGLSVLWITTEMLHRNKAHEAKASFSVGRALQRIDMPSVLFFLGILICISALEAVGLLSDTAVWLDKNIGNSDIIVVCMGLLSAIVDNVPLVAAAMGMYAYPADHTFWLFLAYCVGTGGSVLIIGSAAGVAAMGIAKIDFFWYLKRITPLALAGYLAGAAVYVVVERFFI